MGEEETRMPTVVIGGSQQGAAPCVTRRGLVR